MVAEKEIGNGVTLGIRVAEGGAMAVVNAGMIAETDRIAGVIGTTAAATIPAGRTTSKVAEIERKRSTIVYRKWQECPTGN